MVKNRCEHCGKFVSDNDYYVYTNYGDYTDIDPPDPIYCCGKCLPKAKYTWIKPRLAYP